MDSCLKVEVAESRSLAGKLLFSGSPAVGHYLDQLYSELFISKGAIDFLGWLLRATVRLQPCSLADLLLPERGIAAP